MPNSIEITKVTCISPSTGVSLDATEWIERFLTFAAGPVMLIGAGARLQASAKVAAGGARGAVSLLASPTTGCVLLAVGGVFAATKIATWVAKHRDRDPDDLYIKVNGQKVWPAEEYASTAAGQDHPVNYSWPAYNPGVKALMQMSDSFAKANPAFKSIIDRIKGAQKTVTNGVNATDATTAGEIDEYCHAVELMEWDNGGEKKHDSLGSIWFKADQAGRFHVTVLHPKEGSGYVLDFSVS